MDKSYIVKIVLLATIVLLIGNVVAISRDYQDGWILEGLEIPYVLFVITYTVAFFYEKKELWLLPLAMMGRTIFLLIPNIKYFWFQGLYIDQWNQYNLANQVLNSGHITQIATAYTTSPLLHLSFSISSITLNISLNDSMKYLPVLWGLLYPLIIYLIANRMKFFQGQTVTKYALFLSSIPFSNLSYVVTGTMFGLILAFLAIFSAVLSFGERNWRYSFLLIIFTVGLSASHSVTSFLLSLILLLVIVFQKIPFLGLRTKLRIHSVIIVFLISFTWLVFQSKTALLEIIYQIFVAAPNGVTPTSEAISETFFAHFRANPLSAVRSFSVFYGADAFYLILMIAGMIIMLKSRKKLSGITSFLLLFGSASLLLTLVGTLVKLGGPRAWQFTLLTIPLLCSVFLVWANSQKWLRKWFLPAIIASVFFFSTIELYSYQPLVPSANVLYPNLDSSIPMSYANLVNTVYQRQLVNFADTYAVGTIATIEPINTQISNLTEINNSKFRVIDYFPLDKTQLRQEYDLYLINTPGKSGYPFVGKEFAQVSVLNTFILNSSIFYNNGDSYILGRNLLV
jgi:uncharacterized membrane protein